MSKPKTTKKATAKARKPATKAAVAKAPAESKEKAPREELCVFAFRLTPAERDAIHKAAGPQGASGSRRAGPSWSSWGVSLPRRAPRPATPTVSSFGRGKGRQFGREMHS